MAPQLDMADGYTRVPNELIERVFCRRTFPAYETRLLWAIIRLTLGWNRIRCETSHRALATMTGLDLRHVSRTLKALERKMIIAVRSTKTSIFVDLNMDIQSWRIEGEPDTLFTPSLNGTGAKAGSPSLPHDEAEWVLEHIEKFRKQMGWGVASRGDTSRPVEATQVSPVEATKVSPLEATIKERKTLKEREA